MAYTTQQIVVLEECQTCFDRKKELGYAGPTNFLTTIIRLIRAMKVTLVMVTQEPSKVLTSAIANSQFRMVVGGLGSARDLQEMRMELGLDTPEKFAALDGLKTGQAIVIDPREAGAFPIQIPPITFNSAITDGEVDRIMESRIAKLKWKPRVVRLGCAKEQKTAANEISEEEKKILYLLFSNSLRPSSFYLQKIGSTTKGYRLKKSLLEKGLIGEVEFSQTGKGGNLTLFYLTPRSREVLGLSSEQGMGTDLHRLFQQRVLELGKAKGYKGKVEGRRNGKPVDIILTNGEETIACEVAMSEHKQAEHIRHALAAGLSKVWIFCRTRQVVEKIRSEVEESLKPADRERVFFFLLSSLMPKE